jgi:hypothetical protein
MRSQLATDRCTLNDGISPNAVAAVYYEDADTSSVPETTSDVTAAELAKCSNDALNQTVPFCPLTIDSNPATVETIDITFGSNGTSFLWFMNNSSFRGDYNDPVLLETKAGNLTFEKEWFVFLVLYFLSIFANSILIGTSSTSALTAAFVLFSGTTVNSALTQCIFTVTISMCLLRASVTGMAQLSTRITHSDVMYKFFKMLRMPTRLRSSCCSGTMITRVPGHSIAILRGTYQVVFSSRCWRGRRIFRQRTLMMMLCKRAEIGLLGLERKLMACFYYAAPC